MRRIYYLSTCDTCRKILAQINDKALFEMVDLKVEMIDTTVFNDLRKHVSSYEDLFNKRSRIFTLIPVDSRPQDDVAWRALILTHYTFVKRPIIIFDEEVFIGNSPAVVAAALKRINS